MNINEFMDKRLSTVIWAFLFIWWGMRWSFLEDLPNGSGLLGTGILLLGVNLIRRYLGIQTNPNSTFLGLLTFPTGGALMILSMSQQANHLPVFEIILIWLGILLLGYSFWGSIKKRSVHPNP